MLWIDEVEMVDSLDVEILAIRLWKDSSKFRDAGHEDCFFSEWDIPNSHFKVSLGEQKAQKEGRFLQGRQIASMICDYFEWLSLMIQYWNMLIYSLLLFITTMFRNSMQDGMKFYYVKDSIRWCLGKFGQTENTWVRATQNRVGIVRHGDSSENIDAQLSKNWTQWWRGEKIRNFDYETCDARHGRIEAGAVIKNQKGWSGVEGGKVLVISEKGQCSKGDQCSFRHESNDRAQEPEHNAATPSEPSMTRGRSVSRKKSIKGKSNPGIILRHPSRYYLNGTCSRSLCECWHLPECQSHKNESGCKAGDKCLFPHRMVDEQPHKKPKKLPFLKRKKKRRQKCSGYCENYTTIGFCITRFRCTGFTKRQTVPEKPNAESLGTNSKNTVHSVYASSSKYPGKERTIAWKNTSQTSASAKSIRYEIWGPVPRRETESKQRCARSKAWNLAKYMYKRKDKKRPSYILFAYQGVDFAGCIHHKTGGKRVCCRFRSQSMHMVSKEEDLNSAELETMRISKSPTTVTTAHGEVQTREEATVYVEEFDLFVTGMLFEETSAVLSLAKLCEDLGYIFHWTSGQKPHLTKMARELIAIYKLCAIRSTWFFDEFLYNTHTYFFDIFITGFCIWREQIHRKPSTRKKWKYEWGVTGKLGAWINRNRK